MAEKRAAPAIRFAGFTDAWAQREFLAIATRLSAMSDAPNLPRVEYEDINSGEGTLNKDLVEKVSTKPGIRFQPGDVLYGKLRPYLKNWLLAEFPGIAVGDFWVLRGSDSDGLFLYSLVQSDTFHEIANQSTGTKMPRADWPLVSKTEFFVPQQRAEQRRIGEYLLNLDHLIALHQRKQEKLQTIKKSMLEKLFPREGALVPAVRFAGFTDAWERRKAAELFLSTTDKGHPELPVLSATQDRGMVRRDENSIHVFHNKGNEVEYKRVLPGQFVIHLRSFQGGFAHSCLEGITSPAYTVFGFREPQKHNDVFWKYIFSSEAFIKRLETVTYGIRDGRSISYDEFLTMSFRVPSYREQSEIANYLTQLDRLITLHRRKLEKLQSLKKSMLGKMFV